MKKKEREVLRLLDGAGTELFCLPAYELKIEDTLMKRLSDQFFGDPEPCYIHQSAVTCRVAGEIEMALRGKGRVRLESLPDVLTRYFSMYPDCQMCEITRE